MAKGVHSKRRKKNKSIQRRVLWEAQGKQEHEEIHKRLMKRTYGSGDDEYISRKKNAFRYPNDPSAEIPKMAKPVYIDKRSAYIPIELRCNRKGVMKPYKMEELRQKKEVQDAIKSAEEKMKEEDKKHIDLKLDSYNDMDLDNELKKLDEMNLLSKNEAKKKRKLERKNNIEENLNEDTNVRRKVNKAKNKRKSKSHYIMNH